MGQTMARKTAGLSLAWAIVHCRSLLAVVLGTAFLEAAAAVSILIVAERQSTLFLIVAWVRGRPEPRFRSSAARRR
jgi:hypothetical protein